MQLYKNQEEQFTYSSSNRVQTIWFCLCLKRKEWFIIYLFIDNDNENFFVIDIYKNNMFAVILNDNNKKLAFPKLI